MRKSKSSVSSANGRNCSAGDVKLLLQRTFRKKSKKFEKVVDKCMQREYNFILSSPKSERFSEAQRAGSKPFRVLDVLVGTENFLKKFEKVLDKSQLKRYNE